MGRYRMCQFPSVSELWANFNEYDPRGIMVVLENHDVPLSLDHLFPSGCRIPRVGAEYIALRLRVLVSHKESLVQDANLSQQLRQTNVPGQPMAHEALSIIPG